MTDFIMWGRKLQSLQICQFLYRRKTHGPGILSKADIFRYVTLFICYILIFKVNGVDMTGKAQADAVSVLRNTKMGSTVMIVVSRQEVEDERFKVPRQLVSSANCASH